MTTLDASPELAASVSCPVYTPADPEYPAEIAGFNLAVTHTPAFVVAARTADDVAATVRWAAGAGLPVAVQATGHGANIAVDSGVLISTRHLDGVVVDAGDRTATVEAGAKWKHVLDASLPHGLVGLHGSTTDVGVVGYTLGGGLPVLGRTYGFAANLVRSFEVVTGDGVLRHVDAQHEPELYWALRGGKGNVGVVTSLTFDLVPTPQLYGGAIFYPGEHAPRLLAAYREWVRTVPEAMCSALVLLRLPPLPDIPEPLRGQFVVHLCIAFAGTAEDGARLLAPLREIAPAIMDTVAEMDYADVDHIFEDPDHPVPAKEGCTLLGELTEDAVAALLDQAGPDAHCPLVMVQLRHLGGALDRAPLVADAVTGRGAQFAVSAIGMLAPQVAELVPPAMASLLDAMAPCSTGRSMVNLHGTPGDDADRARAWDEPTYARLCRARATYDPAGLFAFGHAVSMASGA
ncbi:MAG TPA: FAD-binding oxidoreductase [Jatrophihabitantaceae bacterium]|nr:FAD-binding oxidoreductase [Jatrophihabitantaceae bacterium]